MAKEDHKKAIAILLSAAGLLSGADGAAADEKSAPGESVRTREPEVVRPAPSRPDRLQTEPRKPAQWTDPSIQALYGVVVMGVIESGNRAEMARMAQATRRALRSVDTPEGRRHAKEAGLKPGKIAEVRAALEKLEAALAAPTEKPRR